MVAPRVISGKPPAIESAGSCCSRLRGIREWPPYQQVMLFLLLGFLVLYIFHLEEQAMLRSTYKHLNTNDKIAGVGSQDDSHDLALLMSQTLNHAFGEGSNDELKDLDKLLSASSTTNLCSDHDDPAEWRVSSANGRKCECPDPQKPTNRLKKAEWKKHHDKLVQRAKILSAYPVLDVVFVGDSIWEGWNGTDLQKQIHLTKKLSPEKQQRERRECFERLFVKSEEHPDAMVEADILATGGDKTTDLLWQLQNGLMPPQLQPSAWIFMIGTNNLSRKCSKRTVLLSILHVAQYVHEQRPNAKIVIHGLFPRGEQWKGPAPRRVDKDFYELGRYWEQILWINRQLRAYTNLYDDWYYVQNSEIFLAKETTESGTITLKINSTLMKDALHPTTKGYELLGSKLSKQLAAIISS
jgi:lysophospholipase L1-like esterase